MHGICVPQDLAIFVFKKGVPTQNMTFYLQNAYPVVQIPRKPNAKEEYGEM